MNTVTKLEFPDSRLAHTAKAVVAVVIVGMLVLLGDHASSTHRGMPELGFAAAVKAAPATAPTVYFPSLFAAPSGEPEEHVQAF